MVGGGEGGALRCEDGWKAAVEEDPQREPPGVEIQLRWESRNIITQKKNREVAVYF